MRNTIVLATALGLGGCGMTTSTASNVPDMLGTLLDGIATSDAVVFCRLGESQPTTRGPLEFHRVSCEVRQSFHGPVKANGTITVDIVEAGEATWPTEPGFETVYLLTKPDPQDGAPANAWYHSPRANPIAVPADGRDRFFAYLEDCIALVEKDAEVGAIRENLIRRLTAEFPFYRNDAAETALYYEGWTAGQIDTLIALVDGTDDREPLPEPARNNVIPLIVKDGQPNHILPFVTEQLREQNFEGLTIGLEMRNDDGADTMLATLLSDRDDSVVVAAIRLAGLLRNGAILEAFAARYEEQDRDIPATYEEALEEAEALVERE